MVDAELVSSFRSGDADAVRELYARFGGAVFAVGYKALGDRALAEEVVQLTFLKAWQAADRYDEKRELEPWLYTIARRTAIDLFRREERHATTDADVELVSLPSSIEELWEVWEVRSAVDRLPDGEREVIEATHYLGKTMEETAALLDIPVGTVKSRSYRAHGRLAQLLDHVREATA